MAPPAPPVGPPLPADSTSPRRPWPSRALVFAGAVLAGMLLVLAGWLLFRDDSPQSANPSDNSSETSTTKEAADPSVATMTTFINDYLANATTDPNSSWELLTPEFQEASSGFENYQAFWSEQAAAQARDVQADPESLTIAYAVDYQRTNGTTWSDAVQLQLTYTDGTYRIASES